MKSRLKRSKNLSDADIAAIAGVIAGWTQKLTWPKLTDAVNALMKTDYKRQSLANHVLIQKAYTLKKRSLRIDRPKCLSKAPEDYGPLEVATLLERLARCSAEKELLQSENNRLLEQFVVWAYNAHTKNLSKETLNRPLPKIDRESTKESVNKPVRKNAAKVTKLRSVTSKAKRGDDSRSSR